MKQLNFMSRRRCHIGNFITLKPLLADDISRVRRQPFRVVNISRITLISSISRRRCYILNRIETQMAPWVIFS